MSEYFGYILKNADESMNADSYVSAVMSDMNLPSSILNETNSYREPIFRNRLRWHIYTLETAGLMFKPTRGYSQITDLGRSVRDKYGLNITQDIVKKYQNDKSPSKVEIESSKTSTPIEIIESNIGELNKFLKIVLHKQIMEMSPFFFEKLVIDLLKEMGYGNFEGTKVTTASGDDGVDGVVFQDRLGLELVYVQAKRYAIGNNVGRPDLQAFSGALSGKQATKGVFFTTSDFTSNAIEYISRTSHRIIPINGDKLLDLMIEFGVGTQRANYFYTSRLDEDYFSE